MVKQETSPTALTLSLARLSASLISKSARLPINSTLKESRKTSRKSSQVSRTRMVASRHNSNSTRLTSIHSLVSTSRTVASMLKSWRRPIDRELNMLKNSELSRRSWPTTLSRTRFKWSSIRSLTSRQWLKPTLMLSSSSRRELPQLLQEPHPLKRPPTTPQLATSESERATCLRVAPPRQ